MFLSSVLTKDKLLPSALIFPFFQHRPASGPERPHLPWQVPAARPQRGWGHLCPGWEDNLYPRLCPWWSGSRCLLLGWWCHCSLHYKIKPRTTSWLEKISSPWRHCSGSAWRKAFCVSHQKAWSLVQSFWNLFWTHWPSCLCQEIGFQPLAVMS